MLAALSEQSLFDSAPVPRLLWLVQLRWVALSAVVLGLVVAILAGFPWVAPGPIAVAVLVGVLYNLWFLRRLSRGPSGLGGMADADFGARPGEGTPLLGRELGLHALADVGALTLLLLSSGGLRNPICMFYGFHVVLGAMLGLFRGALLSAGVGMAGVLLCWGAERHHLLLAPPLYSPPLWLVAGAALLSILSLGYFSMGTLRFLRREQGRSLRNYELLLTGLDALHVGLELVGPGDRLLLRNRRAAAIHPCPPGDARWRPPEGISGAPQRFAYTEDGEQRIIELLSFGQPRSDQRTPADRQPGNNPGDALRAFLYVDRTESTVNEQRALMLERLASLGRAMQGVAHELNTPLATIQTLAVDLSHALPTSDAAESIALIVDEARRCREITRELLSSARDEAPAERVRTVLMDVVGRAAKLAYGFKPGQGRVVLSGDPELCCVTDANRLLQILVNLLQNARDASDAPVEVHLSREGPTGAPLLEVRDHGPGLSPEVRKRLFVPFVTTKPPGKGTGLGLYTCARLAQQLGAELTLEDMDASGGGVRARLLLPGERQDGIS